MKPAPSLLRYAAPLTALVAILAVATPVGAAPVGTPPAGFTAYVASVGSNDVTPIDVKTGTARDPIKTQSYGHIAITPDATKAYVGAGGAVVAVDLGKAHPTTIDIVAGVTDVAIAADGLTAFATSDVLGLTPFLLTLIDTGTDTAGPPIALPFSPKAIAVAPDGKAVYVVGSDGMVAVDLTTASHPVSKPLLVGGSGTRSIVITPDGTTAFVDYSVSLGGGSLAYYVRPVTLGTSPILGTPIQLPSASLGLAIAPDGTTVYAAAFNHAVYPIEVGSATPLRAAIPVSGIPTSVAVAPDGKTLYVASGNDNSQPSIVTPISITPDGYQARSPITVGTGEGDVAFTPDQAPVAKLAVHPGAAGQATSFDASASSVRYGTIASYKWDFGDGTTTTTASAKTSHTYGKVGKYTAHVTETDSAGTSTELVFTGSTVSRNGGPSAIASTTFTVAAPTSPAAPGTSTPGKPAAGGSTPLPNTGTDTMPMLYGAVGLLLVGSLALVMGRRRHLARHRPSL